MRQFVATTIWWIGTWTTIVASFYIGGWAGASLALGLSLQVIILFNSRNS